MTIRLGDINLALSKSIVHDGLGITQKLRISWLILFMNGSPHMPAYLLDCKSVGGGIEKPHLLILYIIILYKNKKIEQSWEF